MNNLKILITKLSTTTRTALEKSANFCINQQNYEIEIEHLLYELLNQVQKNDLLLLLEKYKISKDGLIDDLKETISQLPKGNSRTPIFAKSIVRLLEQAWLLAAAKKNPVIRSGHLLVALLTAPDLYQIAIRASSLFDLFPIDLFPSSRILLERCNGRFRCFCRNLSSYSLWYHSRCTNYRRMV